MKQKFLRYLSIFLFEAYIVCLFLPIEFGGTVKVFGLNVFFAVIMEEALPLTCLISLLFLAFPAFGLAVNLKDVRKDIPYYILSLVGAVQFLIFISSAIFGFGKGFGIVVCAFVSLILCIISSCKVLLMSNEKDDGILTVENNTALNYCPHCNKPLLNGEECECQKALF